MSRTFGCGDGTLGVTNRAVHMPTHVQGSVQQRDKAAQFFQQVVMAVAGRDDEPRRYEVRLIDAGIRRHDPEAIGIADAIAAVIAVPCTRTALNDPPWQCVTLMDAHLLDLARVQEGRRLGPVGITALGFTLRRAMRHEVLVPRQPAQAAPAPVPRVAIQRPVGNTIRLDHHRARLRLRRELRRAEDVAGADAPNARLLLKEERGEGKAHADLRWKPERYRWSAPPVASCIHR